MGKPEGDVESFFVRKTKEQGFLCWKLKVPGIDGVPDRMLIGHGVVIFVELKAPGETPRRLQCERIKEMREHDAVIKVIDTRQGVLDFIQDLESSGIIQTSATAGQDG